MKCVLQKVSNRDKVMKKAFKKSDKSYWIPEEQWYYEQECKRLMDGISTEEIKISDLVKRIRNKGITDQDSANE